MLNPQENKPVFDLPEDQVSEVSSGGMPSILRAKPVSFDFGDEYKIPNNVSTVAPALPEQPQPPVPENYMSQVKQHLSTSLKSVLDNSVDKYKYQKAYTYNPETEKRQGENFERYYQHPSFSKLGFSPWRDNETLYNQQGSAAGDVWRATKSAAKLYYTGFTSGLKSYADLFSGNAGALDFASEKDMRQANIVGGSTRGGATGFTSNLLVSTGHTLGVASEIALEWLASAAITVGTEGAGVGTLGVAAARTSNTLRNLFKAGKVAETVGAIKNFEVAKAFYEGAKTVGKAINPLEHTMEAVRAFKMAPEMSNLAKASNTAAGFYRDVVMANAVASESKMEGASAYNDERQKLLDQYYEKHGYAAEGKDYEDILDKAYDAGQTTMKWNMPAIFLTNKITFGNMFGKFADLEKYATRAGGEILFKKGVGFETVTPGIKSAVKGLLKPKVYGKAALNYFKGNLSEGIQETTQEIISGAAKDYYEHLYNNPSKQGMDYALSDVGENIGKQFSGQGFETFASGFFMGGLIGGFGHVARAVKVGGLRAYDSATGSNKYELYKQLKMKDVQEKVNILNEMYKNPLQYFGKGILNYSQNAASVAGKNDAQASGDQATWQDWNDQSVWAHVTTALDTNTYGVFLEQLNKISEMDKDSIKEAYGVDGNHVLSEIGKIKKRAFALKDTWEEWGDKYPNPFDPKKFKEGTPERRTEELAFASWNAAKNIGIFYNYSYGRNKDRIKSMMDDVQQQSPVADASFNDLMPLMNVKSLRKDKSLLRQEISALGGLTDSASKKQVKEKTRRLKLLKNYEEALKQHFLSEYGTAEGLGEEGVPVAEKKVRLRGAYEAYIKHLAKQNQVPYIKREADNAFTKIMDIHRLGADNVNLTSTVNLLEDAGGFYEFYDRLNKVQTDLFDRRQDNFEASVKKAQERVELNSLLQTLFERGVIVPSEYVDGVANGIVPKEFYDVAGKQVITDLDPRYPMFAKLVQDFALVNNKQPQQTAEQEENQEQVFTQTPTGRIRIIRHGETVEDEKGINSGPTQEHITQEGAKHVEEGAEGNVDEQLTKIITSSRQRAKDSAEVIAAKGKDISIEENKALDPWNTGDDKTGFAEIPDEDWHKLADWFATHPGEKVYEGEDEALKEKYANRSLVESFNEFKDRVLNALPEITNQLADGGAIMTHSNVIQLLKAYVENGSKNDANIGMVFVKNQPSKNGEFIEFQRRQVNPKFVVSKEAPAGKATPEFQLTKKAQDRALIDLKSRLDKVTNGEELERLESDIESEIIAGEYLSDGVEDLIDVRRQQLATAFDFKDIQVGEILLLNDNKWGKVRVIEKRGNKIKVRRANEEVGGILVIGEKDIHRDIKYKYSKGMKAPQPKKLTAKEKELAKQNLQNTEKSLQDVAHYKKLADEAEKKSAEQIDKEFFNNLGCKK